MPRLTHTDEHGNAHMVDVSDKPITARRAVAEGYVHMGADALAAVVERTARKGDVLAVAQIAGIQGAKRASELIPLCHPLPLSAVAVELTVDAPARRVWARASVSATWTTGVEMEALAAVSAALLTVYDMLKALDRGMELGGIRVIEKHGGRSGSWSRPAGTLGG